MKWYIKYRLQKFDIDIRDFNMYNVKVVDRKKEIDKMNVCS